MSTTPGVTSLYSWVKVETVVVAAAGWAAATVTVGAALFPPPETPA